MLNPNFLPQLSSILCPHFQVNITSMRLEFLLKLYHVTEVAIQKNFFLSVGFTPQKPESQSL